MSSHAPPSRPPQPKPVSPQPGSTLHSQGTQPNGTTRLSTEVKLFSRVSGTASLVSPTYLTAAPATRSELVSGIILMSQQTTDYVIHGIVRSPIGAAEPQSQSRMAGSAAAELAPGSLCPASACPSPAANTEPQANVCSDSPAFNTYVMSCIMY